jgi:hypothetical protein
MKSSTPAHVIRDFPSFVHQLDAVLEVIPPNKERTYPPIGLYVYPLANCAAQRILGVW